MKIELLSSRLEVNLIMDALASLALASEPPDASILRRAPVNRSTSIVTPQMGFNMVGQAIMQVHVFFGLCFLFFPLVFLLFFFFFFL